MRIISPSVLSADFRHIEECITKVEAAGASRFHLDVMDGVFVPNISFGPDIVKKIRLTTNKILDVHLMINPVLPYIKKFVEAGADIISFHIEADNNPLKIIEERKKRMAFSIPYLQSGVAVLARNDLKHVKSLEDLEKQNARVGAQINTTSYYFLENF